MHPFFRAALLAPVAMLALGTAAHAECTDASADTSVCRGLISEDLAMPPPTWFYDADDNYVTCPTGAFDSSEIAVDVTVPADSEVVVTFCHAYALWGGDMSLTSPDITAIGTASGTQTSMQDIEVDLSLGDYLADDTLVFTYVPTGGINSTSGVTTGTVNAAVHTTDEGLVIVGFEDGTDSDHNDVFLVIDFAPTGCDDTDADGVCDDVDPCVGDSDNDSDGDGLCWADDNCPYDANADQADADLDGLGDACDDCTDADGDGICFEDDWCEDTELPDEPTDGLGTWRWGDIDGDGVFDTTESKGKGPRRAYTIEDTAGCSCTQIIDELALGAGHSKHGCSISAMDEWTALVGS